MPDLRVLSPRVGDVLVSEELVESLGEDIIDAAIGQLRFGGGHCWACDAKIHHVDDVSLVVHETAAGESVGFIHMRCGPPQTIDDRRNRRAAIAMARYMKERSTDAQGFVVVRSFPAPYGLLVVSPDASFSARAENGELLSPWLDLSLRDGFAPLAPDVLDATPDEVEGWSLRVEGANLVCGSSDGALFDGPLEMPQPWLNAIAAERRCVVIVASIAVDSNVLGRGFQPALNRLASRGLVAGGTVEVDGVLGLNTALGMEAAVAEARALENLTTPLRHRG